MNTHFLALIPFLFVSSSFAQAHVAAPTTFLDFVKARNTKALQAFGTTVGGGEYREMRFNDAVIEAANMGNLDALRCLDKHACSMHVDSKGWRQVFGIAKEQGNMDMLRFLFASHHIHLSSESFEERIVEACKEDNVELLKMFLLFRPGMADFIGSHLSESAWERLSWLLDSAETLNLLRRGKGNSIADECCLSDELIAFVFSPSSFGFSPATIKDLFSVLQRRYEGSTFQEYAKAILRHEEDGNAVIANFLHDLAVGKMNDVGAFVDEVVKSQAP